MSTTLYFKPVTPRKGTAMPCGVKWILQKKYRGLESHPQRLTSNDLDFLEGVKCSLKDSDDVASIAQLMTAIYDHGEAELFLEG